MTTLLHVSEDGSISHFEPRRSETFRDADMGAVVWAIDRERLPNYLLPRDCPRVTFHARPDSNRRDIECLLGPSIAARVIAIEAAWFERAVRTPLYLYELPADTFKLIDPGAGYYVSSVPVTPNGVRRIDAPLTELLECNVELRIVPSLWALRGAVASSTLQFSFIRLRHATPPQ